MLIFIAKTIYADERVDIFEPAGFVV